MGSGKATRGSGSDSLRRNSELAIERGCRSGSAKAGHADEFAARAEPARPVAFDRGLDADPWGASQDGRLIFTRLPAEQLETRRRDDGGADVFLCKQLCSFQ